MVTFRLDYETLKKLTPNDLKQLAVVMSVVVNKCKTKRNHHGGESKPPKWFTYWINHGFKDEMRQVVDKINSRIDNLVIKNNLKE